MDKIILAVIVIIAVYLISRWINKHTYHDPKEDTSFYYHDPRNDAFHTHDTSHGDPDEHSPENLDLDKSLKDLSLHKEEETEIDDVNINYQDYNGR